MQKERLMQIAENWEREYTEKLTGSRKKTKEKIVKISNAIIKEICKVDGLTPLIAKNSLKMAEDILNTAIENDVIS